jgi:hypothetical protein
MPLEKLSVTGHGSGGISFRILGWTLNILTEEFIGYPLVPPGKCWDKQSDCPVRFLIYQAYH